MSDQATEAQSLELRRYVTILKRRWLVVVLGVVMGVGLGAAYLFVTPTSYVAASLVNINVISSEPFNNPREPSGLIDTQTEVQTVRSSRVVTAASESLSNGATPSDVRSAVAAEVYDDATVVRITYQAEGARAAVDGAAAVAQEYLAYRSELAEQRINTISSQLERRRDVLSSRLVDVNARLAAAAPGSGAATQAESERQLLSIELDSLLTQITAVSGIDTTGGTVLTDAADTDVVVSPRRGFVMITAAVAGLLLGIVLAFVRNVLDRRVFDGYDVTNAGGGQLLGTMASSRQAVTSVDSTDLDAVRSLRERLLVTLPTRNAVLAVADVGRARVPSEVAFGLALAMVETGRTVELILADYPESFLDRLRAELDLTPDATAPVRGARRLSSGMMPRLRVTAIGGEAQGESTAGLLTALLASEGPRADLTLVSLPPRAPHSLRLAAGRVGHAMVLVASRLNTHIDDITRVAQEMSDVGAVVHGTVLVPHRR